MGQQMPPDANQIAWRTLQAALYPQAGRKGDPRRRAAAATQYRSIAEHSDLTPERRREIALMGGAARRKQAQDRRDNASMVTRPKNLDVSQLAKRILDEATGDEPKTPAPAEKNQAAVELGRAGGKKGGAARKASLSPERRKEIASEAAKKRWKGNQ